MMKSSGIQRLLIGSQQLLRTFLAGTRHDPGFQLAVAGAGQHQEALPTVSDILEQWKEGVLKAVPKQKVSHARKRTRQMALQKQIKDAHHFMPCPGCEHGYLKLRHHLCVCRMKEAGFKPPSYRTGRYGSDPENDRK